VCPCKSGVISHNYYDVFISYNKSSENWIREKWEVESSIARDTGVTVPNRPENPEFPTSEDILKKAKELTCAIGRSLHKNNNNANSR
jgi:hypothetical protein